MDAAEPAGELTGGSIIPAEAWKSLSGRRNPPTWNRAMCVELASAWKEKLPGAVLELLQSGNFKGGALIAIGAAGEVHQADI
eukprot:6480445-Alexandrium_andersonii.AAC.1